jgi:hypothetical protein
MSEADERFAARLAEDLVPYLGPEITLVDLDIGEVGWNPARLRATCAFKGGSEILETDGETRLDAYNQLILRAAELRLVVAIRHMPEDAIAGYALAWNALTPEKRV